MAADGLFSFSRTMRAATSGIYGKMYTLLNTYDETNGRFGIANNPTAINDYLREAEMRNTNWFKELFSNSVSMNHSISNVIWYGESSIIIHHFHSWMTQDGLSRARFVV